MTELVEENERLVEERGDLLWQLEELEGLRTERDVFKAWAEDYKAQRDALKAALGDLLTEAEHMDALIDSEWGTGEPEDERRAIVNARQALKEAE